MSRHTLTASAHADHAAERRLAAELRYVPQPGPVNPDLQQLIHVLAQALNDHHRKARK